MWGCSYHLPLLLAFLFVAVKGEGEDEFRICAYNVQKFDSEKAANYIVLHTLTRIISRCDIILLQDVTDTDGSAIEALLSSLNREAERYEGYHYQSESSPSLGRSASDMQKYVFIYRTETVNVLDRYQYQNQQQFVRAPLSVHFHSNKTAIKNFVLIGLHSEPSNAVQELDHLYDVFKEVMNKWKNKNVMFLGDFHAACAYVTRSDKKDIRLFTNTSFSWLIGDKTDTTFAGKTICAYDRIVVYGKTFLKAITPYSAGVFNFAQEFKMARRTVLQVSDHLPVEVRLKSSTLLLQAMPFLLLVSVLIHSVLSSL